MIKLGAKVKDKETGYIGVVTGKAEYLYRETQILVENIDNTGRPIEWWTEEGRLFDVGNE